MARILVIFAYVKRASNLFLVDAGREDVPSRELYLALSESARYLSHCGVKMQVTSFQEGRTSRRVALDLYACFEEMMERWLPEPRKLSVAYSDGELRLITNASAVPAFEDLSLPVKAEQSDDLWFLTISAKGGGVK